mgnify:CR=1 FL=1
MARDRLLIDRENARRKAERDRQEFNNPIDDEDDADADAEAPRVVITGRADKKGHYHDDDDDI